MQQAKMGGGGGWQRGGERRAIGGEAMHLGKIKVERRAVRLVKPAASFPPPPPLVVELSSSDLVVPRVHVEILYAFKAPAVSARELEEGLAKVLVLYREWAGRFLSDGNGRPAIVCNDEGAVFIDASANAELEEVMPFNPSPLLIDLVPLNRGAPELLLLQVTKFTCGGIVLGIARHHQVTDGEGASRFMSDWASAVQGLPVISSPSHDRSLLRGKDPPQPVFDHKEYKKPASSFQGFSESQALLSPLSVKKLHFSAEMLQQLKRKASKQDEGPPFSTFESLTAHLWRCITAARGVPGEITVRALVAANGRRRLNPSLPEDFFGNVIFHACPQATAQELVERPLSVAASIIHSSIKRIDDPYMRSAMDFVELQQKNPAPIARSNRTILSPNLSITSWAQLPLYKVDFGYGTPIYAGPPGVPFEGLVLLVPSMVRDGSIDAVLGLFAPDMAMLEEICFTL